MDRYGNGQTTPIYVTRHHKLRIVVQLYTHDVADLLVICKLSGPSLFVFSYTRFLLRIELYRTSTVSSLHTYTRFKYSIFADSAKYVYSNFQNHPSKQSQHYFQSLNSQLHIFCDQMNDFGVK